MTTLWTVLTAASLFVATISFLLVIVPTRSIDDASRQGAGIALVGATFLMLFAMRFASGP